MVLFCPGGSHSMFPGSKEKKKKKSGDSWQMQIFGLKPGKLCFINSSGMFVSHFSLRIIDLKNSHFGGGVEK